MPDLRDLPDAHRAIVDGQLYCDIETALIETSRSRTRIMALIERGDIRAVRWTDRTYMLLFEDVERLRDKPRAGGRPRKVAQE
jgi:hypothetical protein